MTDKYEISQCQTQTAIYHKGRAGTFWTIGNHVCRGDKYPDITDHHRAVVKALNEGQVTESVALFALRHPDLPFPLPDVEGRDIITGDVICEAEESRIHYRGVATRAFMEDDGRDNVHGFKWSNVRRRRVLNGVVCASRQCVHADTCEHKKAHDSVGSCTDLAGCPFNPGYVQFDIHRCVPWVFEECPEYDGWSNSSTWMFWLYFSQEQKNLNALYARRRPSAKGTINPSVAIKIFKDALAGRGGLSMVPLDDWTDGPINVTEILDHVYQEFGGAETCGGLN